MPRYTIGQILLATVAIGCGLAVARLPQGGAVDFFLVAIGAALASSLLRRLPATLKARQQFAPEDRPSATVFALLMAMTVGGLTTGIILRYYTAAEWVDYGDEDWSHLDLLFSLNTISFMLILLSMQIAIGLGQSQRHASHRQPTQRRLLTLAAIVCLPVALIAYWCNGLLVWLLVYVALNGVDAATHHRPQPFNVARSAQFFALGASFGLPLCLMHLALIAGCVQKWQVRRWRLALSTALGVLVLSECALITWLAGPGLHALSPHFEQSVMAPPWPPTVVTIFLVVLFATWFAFRLTAKPSEPTFPASSPQLESPPGASLFHERFAGALAVGLAATAGIIYQLVKLEQLSFVPDWVDFLYVLTLPDSLMMFATAIWGFTLAWQRSRAVACLQQLPRVDIAQFATLQFAIASAIVLGGPIIAAFSFALMLFGFGATR